MGLEEAVRGSDEIGQLGADVPESVLVSSWLFFATSHPNGEQIDTTNYILDPVLDCVIGIFLKVFKYSHDRALSLV